MKKSETRTINKRARILNSSIRLFKENEIRKVTMDDIASLANVSKMTIYKYFNDKETLYRSVGQTLLEGCYNDLEEQLEANADVIQKMIRCTTVFINFITAEHLTICLRLGQLNEEFEEDLEQFRERYAAIITQIIKDGKKNKLIYEDVSDECLFRYIDMGLNYFQNNLEYRDKIMREPVFRKEFMTFIWRNIFTDHSSFSV